MRHQRPILSVATTLVFWGLAGTMSAIAFGSVFAGLLMTIIFGHPLFFAGGLMLGPLAGAIGGPVFGLVNGALAIRRGRSGSRTKHVFLVGILGGVIFGVVGAGYLAWLEEEESHQPTVSPKVVHAAAGQAVEPRGRVLGSNGAVHATPDGGRVIEHRKHPFESERSGFDVATATATAIGGFLYGGLFGAVCRTTRLRIWKHRVK